MSNSHSPGIAARVHLFINATVLYVTARQITLPAVPEKETSARKSPKDSPPGCMSKIGIIPGQPYHGYFFSHPDYTVGPGISPGQPPKRVADYTAGREFPNASR